MKKMYHFFKILAIILLGANIQAFAQPVSIICPDSVSTITGADSVCQGLAIALSDTASGGVWSSGDLTVATVDPSTGVVTGVGAGTAAISYTLAIGCMSVDTIMVNPTPAAIAGLTTVCVADSVILSDGGGGTWSSADTTVSVDMYSGAVAGVSAGSATITYTLSTGCNTLSAFTVNPLPAAITGPGNVCVGSSVTLSDTTGGGTWYSASSSNATINPASGVVNGLSADTTTIIYTSGGCNASTVETVNPLPAEYTKTGGYYCEGGTGVHIMLSNSDTGVSYILSYSGSSLDTLAGTDTALNFPLQTDTGFYHVTAINNSTGCAQNMPGYARIRTHRVPHIHTVTGGGSFCAGGTGVAVGVDSSRTGVNYELYNGATIVDTVAGADTAISFGLQKAAGTYKVVAMDTTTGCTSNMADSAVVIVIPLVTPLVTITTNPGDTVCMGTLVTFRANPVHPGSSPAYQWNVNGTNVGADTSFYSYVPVNNDHVYIAMTSNAVCAADTLAFNTLQVTVDSPFIPTVSITATAGTYINKGQKDTLRAHVFNGGASPSYQWYLRNAAIIGATNSTYSYPAGYANNDSFSCVVTTGGVCKYQTVNSVIIEVSSVGIGQIASGNNNVIVVPNPSKGAFTIKGAFATANDEEVTLVLTNMVGQVVYKNKVMTQDGNINEQVRLNNELPSGSYLLNVVAATDQQVFHIVIEK